MKKSFIENWAEQVKKFTGIGKNTQRVKFLQEVANAMNSQGEILDRKISSIKEQLEEIETEVFPDFICSINHEKIKDIASRKKYAKEFLSILMDFDSQIVVEDEKGNDQSVLSLKADLKRYTAKLDKLKELKESLSAFTVKIEAEDEE